MASNKVYISVDDLCRLTGITANQANDYISRTLLVVASREGRKRLLKNPPAAEIVSSIRQYLEDHGNLNRCAKHLKDKFPEYYRNT